MITKLSPAQLEAAGKFAQQVREAMEGAAKGSNLPGDEWAKHYYPKRFYRPFTQYQKDFWLWGDTITKDDRTRPRVECEPRGVGKSSNARGLIVKLLADKKKYYVLYVSATDEQAQKHFNAIRSMLEAEAVLSDYPHLAPQSQKHRPNVNKNWSSERLVTAEGQVVEFISLLGNARGFTTEEGMRPDVIVLDDIDDSKDSPHMVQKKLDILKFSIIPAKAANTLILFPQNLIHRDSICQQIRDQRADILNDRIFVGAFPLMKWYEAEKVEMNDGTGAMRWTITAGEVFDEATPLSYCEELLNDGGKDSFDRECQQDVFKVAADKDFREWNEVYHIITHSEFKTFFEANGVEVWNYERNRPQIPHNWNVGEGLDWGTTVGHPSVCTSVARPNQYAPLNDCFFIFAEIVLPKYPLPTHEEVPLVSPGRVAAAIKGEMKVWNIQDGQVKMRLMSHEASAALATMAVDLAPELKEFFSKWKAQKGSGVPQIQNLLEINYKKPHPFRIHPATKHPIMGCPRIFFLVSDEQGRLLLDSLGKLIVAQPKDAEGLARARFEMPIYNHMNSGQHKIDDDYVDALRGIMNVFGVSSKAPSELEKFIKKMEDKGLTSEAIEQTESEADKLALIQQKMIEVRAFAEKQKQSNLARRVGVIRRR